MTPALVRHSHRLRRDARRGHAQQILERGTGAAGRPAGRHRGRAVRHAGHYQPPQGRSSLGRCGSPSSARARRSACPRSAAIAPSAARPTRETSGPARRHPPGRTAPRILIDTPPELRLQLVAGGFSSDRRGGLHPRARRPHQRHRRPPDVLGAPAAAAADLRTAGDARRAPRRPSATSSTTSVRPYEGTSKPELEAARVEPGRPVTMAGRRGAAARLPARPPPGLRLPLRHARLPHRREGDSRGRARPARRASRCW